MIKAAGKRIVQDYSEFERINFTQLLDTQAARRPDKVWLVHGDERVTFGEFSDRTDRLAAALRKHGLKKGEFCGLLYPNGPFPCSGRD